MPLWTFPPTLSYKISTPPSHNKTYNMDYPSLRVKPTPKSKQSVGHPSNAIKLITPQSNYTTIIPTLINLTLTAWEPNGLG